MLSVLIFTIFSVYLQYSLANEKNKSSNIWIFKKLVVSLSPANKAVGNELDFILS